MFTGIIEEIGIVERAVKGDNLNLRIKADKIKAKLKPGSSIAVNGVCLTAIKIEKDFFETEVTRETVSKSNLAYLKDKDRVNLESSLILGQDVSGHFVLGHVDGVARLKNSTEIQGTYYFHYFYDQELIRFLPERGSVAINGASLTIVKSEQQLLTVAITPYTMKNTNLGITRKDSPVNIEIDLMVRYLNQLNRFNSSRILSSDNITGNRKKIDEETNLYLNFLKRKDLI